MSRTSRPPVAEKKSVAVTVHGDTRIDDYAWLRDKSDRRVIRHLKAENEFTQAQMRSTVKLQRQLFREIRGRIKETDLDVPVPIDDWFYYSRTKRGQQYATFCRKHGSLKAREQVILDHNQLAARHKFFHIDIEAISPDHRLLAYTFDIKGDERFTLRIKDLDRGKLLPDSIPNVANMAWAADSRTILYVTLDQAHRPYKVFRHHLGEPVSADVLIHHERDEAFYLGVHTSRSRKLIFVTLSAKTSTEVRFLAADRPKSRLRIVEPRRPKLEYHVDHHGDDLLIVNNHRAKNFKLDRAPTANPGLRHWRSVIAHRPNVLLGHVAAFSDYVALFEREDGLEQMRVLDPVSGRHHRVEFDEPVYSVSEGTNLQYRTDTVRFVYNSLVTPTSVFDYDMRTRTRTLRKQIEVRGGYNPKQYRSERIFATGADGVRVPISLVYRKGVARNGRAPTLLNGYGSYGISRDPNFSIGRLSLLDRGVIFAIAHVRGGSELGRDWYEDGKFLKKRNTFTDFIACAERLIERRYTRSSQLAINGGSAGGLLMGAVANLRPDLFGVVVADVPFVDCLNTMLDASLPLTVTEYDEWGNPNERKYYRYMKSYSPYDNVRPQAYPTMLVTAGLNDPRVGFWEPAKWVAKLRELKRDTNELLLKTEMGSGHFGASGRYDAIKDVAFEFAFILTRLGVEGD